MAFTACESGAIATTQNGDDVTINDGATEDINDSAISYWPTVWGLRSAAAFDDISVASELVLHRPRFVHACGVGCCDGRDLLQSVSATKESQEMDGQRIGQIVPSSVLAELLVCNGVLYDTGTDVVYVLH